MSPSNLNAFNTLPSAHDLIDRVVFGTLVTCHEGQFQVNRLPFTLDRSRGTHGTLESHIPRRVPQAQLLERGEKALVSFMGVNGYISSAWLAQRASAPTWNYASVDCVGAPKALIGTRATRCMQKLVDHMESDREGRWHIDELGEAGEQRRMQAILCFEIGIDTLTGTLKLGQNDTLADARSIHQALQAKGDFELAHWMTLARPA